LITRRAVLDNLLIPSPGILREKCKFAGLNPLCEEFII
jgi:hypothetical protein